MCNMLSLVSISNLKYLSNVKIMVCPLEETKIPFSANRIIIAFQHVAARTICPAIGGGWVGLSFRRKKSVKKLKTSQCLF